MRSRQHPFKWPLVITLALVCFFAGIFLVPAQWINLFFSPLNIQTHDLEEPRANWIYILPPPVIESIAEVPKLPKDLKQKKRPAPAVDDPGWWTDGWQVRTVAATPSLLAVTSRDSIAQLMEVLGVGTDFIGKVLPDSLLNHRLMLLRLEDGFKFDELKSYLAAMGRAKAMADIKSREAAMVDNHLQSTIMVPD